MNDAELLDEYSRDRSEDAFRSLVNRYVRLVYGACWRQLGDRHLAEDATQGVFVLLSQKAGKLRPDRLAGWLLTAARYASANIRKTQLRRQRREQVVSMLNRHEMEGPSGEMRLMLDEGLARLRANDRQALVLRYFQEQPLREVGQNLGISEEAARKRVDRGLEKLRSYFMGKGVRTSCAALAAVLAEEANSAPLMPEAQQALTDGILAACHTAGGNGLSIAAGIKSAMLLAKLQVAAIVLLIASAAGGLIWVGLTGNPHAPTESRQLQATPTASILPTTLPAQDVVLDLSTPEKCMESFFRAAKASDRQKMYQCLDVDPNRAPTPLDALIQWGSVQNRLIRAVAKAYGTNGEESRQLITIDVSGPMALLAVRLQGKGAVIEGDAAKLIIELPDALLKLLPPEGEQWSGHALRFRRLERGWVMEADHFMRIQMVLIGRAGQPNQVLDNAEAQTALLLELSLAMEQTAAEVEQGRFATWRDASESLSRKEQEAYSRRGDFVAVNVMGLPPDAVGVQP